ncbi:MAG TPA: type II and III secretion system protein [Bryobacteraceae bacterium]|nr:type II and III secretion system protein [Bryobacteraceae bacterium]
MKVCWPVIVLFIASCGASMPLAAASQAEQLFRQAQKAERDGEIVKAYVLYAEAAAADPSNIDYWSRAQALRPAASLKDASPPEPPGFPSDKIDRTLFGTITEAELDEARKPLPPPRLQADPGRRDYDFQGDSKALWEQMAAALKLKVLFDGDYRPTRAIHFELADADYRSALQSLQLATNSFLVPVSQRLIFIANDSTQKRRDFEPTVTVTMPFPEGITVQALQELGTIIRGVLDAQKVSVDTTQRLILIRDKITKVRLAEKLVADFTRPRAQVIIDVEILTTDVSSSLSYGLSLPTSFPIASFVKRANLINYIPSGFSTFLAFGGGASLLGLGVTNAQLFATVSNSNSQSIYHGQVVAAEGVPSTLHVGEKYPFITSGYFGNTSGSGTVYTPPPTISFEDLGLSIKVTPHIVSVDEVALDLDAEFKLLGATSSNGIPVVGNTQYQSKVNVMAGEWAVLSGLMTSREAKTITGIPLLSYIPLLRQTTISKDRGTTLIVLKPHVTVAPPSATPAWRAWMGTETRTLPDL